MPLRLTAKLQAGLKILFRIIRRRLGNGAGVSQRVAQRCFAVNMLPCLKCGEHDSFMLMRSSGNDHSLHIFVRQQILEFFVAFRFRMFAFRAAQHWAIVIANSNERRAWKLGEVAGNLAPMRAIADKSHPYRRRRIVRAPSGGFVTTLLCSCLKRLHHGSHCCQRTPCRNKVAPIHIMFLIAH